MKMVPDPSLCKWLLASVKIRDDDRLIEASIKSSEGFTSELF